MVQILRGQGDQVLAFDQLRKVRGDRVVAAAGRHQCGCLGELCGHGDHGGDRAKRSVGVMVDVRVVLLILPPPIQESTAIQPRMSARTSTIASTLW